MDKRLEHALQARSQHIPQGRRRTVAELREITKVALGRAASTGGKPRALHPLVTHLETARRALEADRTR